ncbi:MAG: hypothetical protein V7723_07620 [Sneathiella sp.]|uniref:hypothetical protein n=1 Tax=Sneathiella sp. TaxID=1964365 RepID=UPI0030017324
MQFFRLSIVTKIERNTALSQVRDYVSEQGGWSVDHTLFSNMAATLNVELPMVSLADFITSLEQAGYSPKTETPPPAGDGGDIRVSISLTFIHNDPDLKQTVPAFG